MQDNQDSNASGMVEDNICKLFLLGKNVMDVTMKIKINEVINSTIVLASLSLRREVFKKC